MGTGSFCLVLAGVSFATVNLMKLIAYIDSPQRYAHTHNRD